MKRDGVTLVELIFTIVIIAVVFTVVPKIIFAINKSDTLSIREDALLNGVSMLHMIANMPWDENSVNYRDILDTNSSNFHCDKSSFYRVGGFAGSRRCSNDLNATPINSTLHGGDDIYMLNDVGDFNNSDVNVTAGNRELYDLNISVKYMDDGSMVFAYQNQSAIIDLNRSKESSVSTNLKRVDVDIFYSGDRGVKRVLAKFSYTSSNIGLVEINKREW